MTDLFAHLTKLLAKGGLWLGIGISLVLAIGSIALVAYVVIHWPADHFKAHLPGVGVPVEPTHPVARAAKNVGGFLLILLGLVMALPGIPGQGILTMIIGFTLVDFPGKRRLERRLIGRPSVLRRINGLRARFQRGALELD
jgi:hypothetical protein